jgi:hypothetical protein
MAELRLNVNYAPSDKATSSLILRSEQSSRLEGRGSVLWHLKPRTPNRKLAGQLRKCEVTGENLWKVLLRNVEAFLQG